MKARTISDSTDVFGGHVPAGSVGEVTGETSEIFGGGYHVRFGHPGRFRDAVYHDDEVEVFEEVESYVTSVPLLLIH